MSTSSTEPSISSHPEILASLQEVSPAEKQEVTGKLKARGLLPLAVLRPTHDPMRYKRPRLLHFGIGFKLSRLLRGESLTRYAIANEVCVKEREEDPGKLGLWAGFSAEKAVEHLSKELNYRLVIVLPISADYDGVVAVYNNYDLCRNMLKPAEQARIVDAIREIVEDVEQQPMWYYDSMAKYGDSWYPRRRPFPHYNDSST